jgi:hypothetical protein
MPLSPFSRTITIPEENAAVGFAEKDFGATLRDRVHDPETSKTGHS